MQQDDGSQNAIRTFMKNKVKVDRKKVEYDGNSIRLIIPSEEAFLKKVKEKQQEILKDLEKQKEARAALDALDEQFDWTEE